MLKRNRRFVRLKRPFNETRRRFAHAKTPSCFSELGTNSHASAHSGRKYLCITYSMCRFALHKADYRLSFRSVVISFLSFLLTFGLKDQKHLARAERKRRPELITPYTIRHEWAKALLYEKFCAMP